MHEASSETLFLKFLHGLYIEANEDTLGDTTKKRPDDYWSVHDRDRSQSRWEAPNMAVENGRELLENALPFIRIDRGGQCA